MAPSPHEHDRQADEDPGSPPTEVSKPLGDAIPTPVEPGLDQPLPKKGETPPPAPDKAGKNSSGNGGNDNNGDALGDTDPPPGVPGPGPSDFA